MRIAQFVVVAALVLPALALMVLAMAYKERHEGD